MNAPPTDPPAFRYIKCYLCKHEDRSDRIEYSEWNEWLDAHVECETKTETGGN